MHQALGHQPPIQPLTIMAYPSHQPLPQQNCHCTAIPLAQAQPKEQDLLLKCMAQLETAVKAQQEEATNRMTQLETAVKAQQEEASQGSAAMKQYVSEQMAEWRTWKESDEPQPSRKRNKSEPAQVTQHSEPIEPNHKLQAPPVTRQPALGERQADQGTMELEDRPSILQRLTGLESQIMKHSDMGIKRHRPPSQEDQRPAKRTTRSEKAYSDPFGIFDSKQSSPRLSQKNKAQPTLPPWRAPPTVAHSKRRPQSPGSESARPPFKPTGQEIALTSPTPPDEDDKTGQLPPLADFDGKAINHEYPPFATLPAWEVEQSQIGSDGYRRHAIWRQLCRETKSHRQHNCE